VTINKSCKHYERLEEKHANFQRVSTAHFVLSGYLTLVQADPEALDQLRSDMQSLLTEVSELSRRNDEIMQARDQDLVVIQDLNAQIKEYKRKYELAKTELRNVKGALSISVGPTLP
jgi:archaellum component FlaC